MMVTLSAGGSGESPTPPGAGFNSTAHAMVTKGAHPLTTRRRRVGKGTISGYGGYKGGNVADSNSGRQSASNPDPRKGQENITHLSGAPGPNSSSAQPAPGKKQPQHSSETASTPSKPCHSARMSSLCCQNAIRMGARAQLGLCPPGRPRRALQAALRQRTRASSNSTHPSQLTAMSRRISVASSDPNGYYAIEKMIGTQSLEDYEDQEEDYLLSTNTFDVESDEEASSGDEDELSTMESLLAPDASGLDDESKYMDLREPMFTPIGVDGTNPGVAPMVMGSGASGKLPFNRRKLRYFDGITAQDRQAARDYLNEEAVKARRRSALLLKRHLRRMQREERRKRRIQRGEPVGNDDVDMENPQDTDLIEGGVSVFDQPMTAAVSAALILESLALHPIESIEGMAKCYDGIVAAGVALLESQHADPSSPIDAAENDKPRTSRADVLAALAPLLITSLEQPAGDTILLLARMRRMCGTPRYQRRFVQRVAPCLIRPKNAAMWCLRHQHDMEPIVAAAELIFDQAHTIFGKGWYEKGQCFLADSKRVETLNSAAAQLRNLSGEPSEGLSLGLSSTHGHGIRRYTSAASHKDHKTPKDQLAEWEVMAVDKEIRISISKVMSSDWSRVNLSTVKDSDSVRSFRRSASSAGKRPTALPQSSSGEASPRAMLSPKSPSRPLGIKTPLSPPPPKDFTTPAPPADNLFENIMPSQPPPPADRPTSPDSALVQKNGNAMVMSPLSHRHNAEDMDLKTASIVSSTPPRSPKSPMRGDGVEQAPPLAKLNANISSTPFTPISPRRSRALSPPSSHNIREGGADGQQASLAPFTPSLGTSSVAPLSPSSLGTSSTSDLVSYRPGSGASVTSTGPGALQAAHYRTLTSTASERKRTVAACRALRAQITRFEDAFIQLHGRPPKGAAERAPLATTYSQYREWKRAIRADAACRIQALFRGASTRWVLLRDEDEAIGDIIRRRAGRHQFAREAVEQAPRQPTSQAGLFLPNDIGEPDHGRSPALKPASNSSIGSSKGSVTSMEESFPGQSSGQMLTPQSQWATEVVRRRTAAGGGRTHDGSPVLIAQKTLSSPMGTPPPNSTLDMSGASLPDLQAKKRELKQQLKQYDMNFARRNGRMPVKAEKEPIRHLYENYNLLKSQISSMEQEGPGARHGAPGIQQLTVNAVPQAQPQPSRLMTAPPTPPDSSDSDRSIDSSGLLGSSRGKRKQLKSPPMAASSTPPGAPSQDLAALKAEKGQLHQMLRSYEKDFFKEHNRQVSSFADIKPVASQYRRYKEIKKTITALQGASER